MKKWIKKDDKVVVIAGNEKGRVGKVLSRKDERVVVQGLNIRKKHIKRKSKMPTPEIMEKEMSMHISNVQICGDDDKPLKLKVKQTAKSKKLVYEAGGKEVVYREIWGAKA
jgi:large subunit ribosomal protein L24